MNQKEAAKLITNNHFQALANGIRLQIKVGNEWLDTDSIDPCYFIYSPERIRIRPDIKPKSSIEELASRIQESAVKYEKDYGITPNNVCLGPEEFSTLVKATRSGDPTEPPPDIYRKLAPVFYQGMHVRLLSSPGVFVGTLI